MFLRVFVLTLFLLSGIISAQSFYFGADMSYVNEMEDCGVEYFENKVRKDPFQLFDERGCDIIRLRLWHTPAWYDTLNQGKRYSDLTDVKKSIARTKANNMQVLLDFHLSDGWADPSKQLVPQAWQPVVNNLPLLKDSLYNYIYKTLTHLNDENLLPEMIQIGNEVNKGILLSPEDNKKWTLDWERNAALFKHAIQAVEDFEKTTEKDVKIVLHVADPANAEWMIDGFISYGVTNFDIIGLSYYWAWHRPTTTAQAGDVIRTFRRLYPEKEVIVVETGYIWTTEWKDQAPNIISHTHPDYHPPTPEVQRDWLIELTQTIMQNGGSGVMYWEPAWVSSNCFTPWGQGSHQEHATFFDFENQLLLPGGIEWMQHDYDRSLAADSSRAGDWIQILTNSFSGDFTIRQHTETPQKITYTVTNNEGKEILSSSATSEMRAKVTDVPNGIYVISVLHEGKIVKSKKMNLGHG